MVVPGRVAFRLPSSNMDVTEQMRIGKLAAESGYDAVFTSETWGYDAFTRLGYLAAETDAALGTAIVPTHSRSPSLLGQTIGTLSGLTDQRTILGIGLSSPAVIENWYGVEFEPALRREREVIEIVQAVLSGDPVDYDGELFDLDFGPVRFDPPTDVSVHVAAQGETNRRLVGEFADGWIPSYIPLSALDDALVAVQDGSRARDRDPDDITTVPFLTTCVLEDGETAKQRCRATVAFYIGAMGDYHHRALADHGYADTAAAIREASDNDDYDAARAAVTDELLSEVALAGTPEEAREQLHSLPEVVDTLVTVPSTRATPEEVERTASHVGDIVAE